MKMKCENKADKRLIIIAVTTTLLAIVTTILNWIIK